MLLLMLAAVERAVGLSFESQVLVNQRVYERPPFFTIKRVLVLALLLAVVSLAVCIPSAAGLLPVKPFRDRYVCSISR
ncbi:unnamed protein product [Strongylus vulgaris]|uniref:Uncharacterized protein n=1 Tax=Strongylus vulgaris TaxID=40348 RepID=A0A3P7L6S6_STRVU|nr:unnamed protein product [Strongylus vulgaris]